MSTLARALLAQIETAAHAGDVGAVRQTLARCATAVTQGEFEAGEAGMILWAVRMANKAMGDEGRRVGLIIKAPKVAETKCRVDRAHITLSSDQFKTLGDWDWTTQLLAAGNTQKGRLRQDR